MLIFVQNKQINMLRMELIKSEDIDSNLTRKHVDGIFIPSTLKHLPSLTLSSLKGNEMTKHSGKTSIKQMEE